MTVGANSYGAVADVAAYTRVYTNAGTYDTTTNPTLTQVEGFIDQISAVVNTALAGQGFSIPVTNATGVLALKSLVTQLVADLCHAANSQGRFFTQRAMENGLTPLIAIRKDVAAWIDENASGLEALGASRAASTASTAIGYRDTNEAGDETFPIFQRDGFGNQFDNWDV